MVLLVGTSLIFFAYLAVQFETISMLCFPLLRFRGCVLSDPVLGYKTLAIKISPWLSPAQKLVPGQPGQFHPLSGSKSH